MLDSTTDELSDVFAELSSSVCQRNTKKTRAIKVTKISECMLIDTLKYKRLRKWSEESNLHSSWARYLIQQEVDFQMSLWNHFRSVTETMKIRAVKTSICLHHFN